MVDEDIEIRVHNLCRKGDYQRAVDIILQTEDSGEQLKLCWNALLGDAMGRAIAEYGEIMIFKDRRKYEEAKAGMGNISPHAALYGKDDEDVEGIDELLEFVPEDNPVRQLFYKLTSR